eukprot:CAMPEP_0172696516 /NCGR_PEP_ID=MMETSP1074-20121228/28108_1 /TAXON_ID=2916 /ORGANISM="Ceratium fusus, Strain PA161109" /LENGTH=49 /DNA_ID=CAMNT_0013517271 /DNA_START=527 /DNA_END=676 /DNA_ORIENTATION=+
MRPPVSNGGKYVLPMLNVAERYMIHVLEASALGHCCLKFDHTWQVRKLV